MVWARDVFDSAGRHPYTACENSNIPNKQVTRDTDLQLASRHSAFARLLSLLLLGFIFYGTTVEAAHSHRRLARATNVEHSSSASVPGSETETRTNLVGCGDCLICQLHQNFSTGIVSAGPDVSPSVLNSSFFKLNTVSVHSHTSTAQTGRAPPRTT